MVAFGAVMRLGALEFKCHWCPLLEIFRGVQAVKLYMTLRDRDLLTKKGIHDSWIHCERGKW